MYLFKQRCSVLRKHIYLYKIDVSNFNLLVLFKSVFQQLVCCVFHLLLFDCRYYLNDWRDNCCTEILQTLFRSFFVLCWNTHSSVQMRKPCRYNISRWFVRIINFRHASQLAGFCSSFEQLPLQLRFLIPSTDLEISLEFFLINDYPTSSSATIG